MRFTDLHSFRGKVCIVAPLPPPCGGMSVQAEKLIRLLEEEGISVEPIATNPSPPAALKWIESIPGVRTLLRETQYLFTLFRKGNDCDVIHHFSASGLYFFLQSVPVLLLGCALRKKIIFNYRGGNAEAFLKDWGWCAVPVMRLARPIAVPSEFLQRVFEGYGLNVALLPNIADIELFPWKKRVQFAPRFLVTRNLEPMYNLECVLRAFRLVQRCFPGAVLGIAGDGSDKARLENLAKGWNLSGVTFYGHVSHQQLPGLYAAHDIYINSSNVDNFPGALVEAACSGLPIVTTRAGGISCMIRDGDNGVLVDLNDDAALAAGVLEIIEDHCLGQRLAQHARVWAEQFSWKNIFPTLLQAYGGNPSEEMSLPQREALTTPGDVTR